MRRLLFVLVVLIVTAIVAPFAGPLSSGALLLLVPAHAPSEAHDLPESYLPLHKGDIDLSTGLYSRRDEDIVLRETPHLVLRRVFFSKYPLSREFGIGTTHTGEKGLAGDGDGLQRLTLFPTNGGALVKFRRISPGRSFATAVYEHQERGSRFHGARLGWIGFGWAMRLRDGSRLRFLKCTPAMAACPVVEEHDADGHSIHYRRDAVGRLLRMEASPDRWIAFDYDARDRITRAHASTGREVRYEYDADGRLSLANTSGGTMRRYTYTEHNQMRTIEEPDIFIENTYDADGRCIRQVNRFPGEPEPYTFDFVYKTTGAFVHSTEVRRSDTTWAVYTFNDNRDVMSESWGSSFSAPVSVKYERDLQMRAVTSVTVRCAGRTGDELSHTHRVTDGMSERKRDELIEIYCSSGWRSRRQEVK